MWKAAASKEFPFTFVWNINKSHLAYFCENSFTLESDAAAAISI
jgi:hypothetical protein